MDGFRITREIRVQEWTRFNIYKKSETDDEKFQEILKRFKITLLAMDAMFRNDPKLLLNVSDSDDYYVLVGQLMRPEFEMGVDYDIDIDWEKDYDTEQDVSSESRPEALSFEIILESQDYYMERTLKDYATAYTGNETTDGVTKPKRVSFGLDREDPGN
jgi:hypothetical protein